MARDCVYLSDPCWEGARGRAIFLQHLAWTSLSTYQTRGRWEGRSSEGVAVCHSSAKH